MQLEGDGEGYKTILMDPIAIDEPLYMVNSDEFEVAMIAFDEATIALPAIRSILI